MKLIIADPYVNTSSPTMRGIVASLDYFADLFESIEVWASDCRWDHHKVKIRRVCQPIKPWLIQGHYYSWRVRNWASELPDNNSTIIQTTGCLLKKCDIRYIQFWNQLYIEETRRRPQAAPSKIRSLMCHIAAREESVVERNPSLTGNWWTVSRAMANAIKKRSDNQGVFSVIPNQYDPDRFNHSVRKQWREPIRKEYGFMPDEKIFAFSAFGHFERKGLRQAVECVEILRRNGHKVRILILGGSETVIRNFSKSITNTQLSGCLFAGMVDHVERHLASADAFLFPSHFEAFSLAEIEAAALGIRLYLTPHYGSEMIMREPTNGRMLPWDPIGMASVIGDDIQNGKLGIFHHEMGEAVSKKDYGERLRQLYGLAIANKQTGSR